MEFLLSIVFTVRYETSGLASLAAGVQGSWHGRTAYDRRLPVLFAKTVADFEINKHSSRSPKTPSEAVGKQCGLVQRYWPGANQALRLRFLS